METQTKGVFDNIEVTELVLSLIQAELKNSKLIQGLNSAGVLIEDFDSNLADAILCLAGFQKVELTDQLYDYYFQLLNKHTEQQTDKLIKNIRANALEIYNELLLERMKGINFGK